MESPEFCHGQISLEITESLWIENLSTTVGKLNWLKGQNIGISIDDFGTGYSSLSYLSQLPIDMLKIDRAFISHLQERHLNQEIVAAILALSDPLGVRAVAEGIETLPQLRWLRKLGCELGQGDLFAPPLLPQDAVAWLKLDPCLDFTRV
jgi:EAL domain-containing protein (putative c-di-GMP-specific phosphodiesterase class I)